MESTLLIKETRKPFWKNEIAILAILALIKLAAHMAVSGNYGYFRDTLYYVAAGNHLAWGYVEFPPLIAAAAALIHAVTGGSSLAALQFFPALASAVLMVLTGLMARQLGGGRMAQILAAVTFFAGVGFLATGSVFSMDVLDQLWWGVCAYIFIRMIKENQPRYWLAFGLAAGIGLETKITILFFGFALVIGLLLTPQRSLLRSRWLWIGGGIALLFILPYILWNWTNGWPTIEFWGGYGNKLNTISPLNFLAQQILITNPISLPLWVAGLYGFFFTRLGKPYRALGWAFIILFTIFATRFKAYFLVPAYPMLFAMGSVFLERVLWQPGKRAWLPAYAFLVAAAGVAFAPVAMPILSPEVFGRYYGFLGGDAGVKMENRQTTVLPQWLADRFGWDSLTAGVSDVFHSLPPEEQAAACIYANNYGEAGAIDLLGKAYGLPNAISGHNNYFLWGPGDCTGKVIISVGISPDDMEESFETGKLAKTVTCSACMPDESRLDIYVWRDIKVDLRQAWPTTKKYD